tara:strand:+ start:3744 stop:4187 length:444 start_codon:yes stop_codon:yes gene_type:complete
MEQIKYMNEQEWESVDEETYMEAGEKDIVQVSKEKPYLKEMVQQNQRVFFYLTNKYPQRKFRISKWHNHEFGDYQEVEEEMLTKNDIMEIVKFNEQVLEALIEWNMQKKEEGFIPTVDMLIEESKKALEEEMVDEANRLVNNDKAND